MMLIKYKYLAVLFFLTIENAVVAQNEKTHALALVISFPTKVIQNADDLKFKILIKNNSSNSIKVYKYLAEGYAEDPTKNLNLEVEKKGSSGYHYYSKRSFYQRVPEIEPANEIEKVELKAKDSLINFLHLDDAYLFEPGRYRLKCIYKNDLQKGGKIASSWVYFRVITTIPITHHYND